MKLYHSLFITFFVFVSVQNFAQNSAYASNATEEDMRLGKYMTFTPNYTYEKKLPSKLDKGNTFLITSNQVTKEHIEIDEFKNTPLFCELEFSSYGNVINPYAWNYMPVNGNESMSTVFYNTYYELEKHGKVQPYANLGLGMAWLGERGDSRFGGLSSVSELAWNAGFGFDFEARNDISIDVGYRYSDLNIASNSHYLNYTTSGKEENVHQLIFNIEYVF